AETLEMAGLKVASAEIEPFPLLRAVDRSQGRSESFWRGQSQGYIQIKENSSAMYVAQENALRFVRVISWGSERLTQALADALELSPEEAEAIKTDPSASVDPQGIFSWEHAGVRRETEALVSELERLRREIERLMNYYSSLFPERSYEGVMSRV